MQNVIKPKASTLSLQI